MLAGAARLSRNQRVWTHVSSAGAIARTALACCVVTTLVAAAPAEAATQVTVRDLTTGESAPGDISIEAGPEANRIVIRWSDQLAALIVHDRETVTGDRCDQLSMQTVSCPFDYAQIWISGNRGHDRIMVRRNLVQFDVVFADGGPGNDLLIGGSREDFLTGGDGSDELAGRGGSDIVIGDFPRAVQPATERGNDILRGGRGDDSVGDYFDRGSDQLFGGMGDDEVAGKDGAEDEVIVGGPGDDRCNHDVDDPAPRRCEDKAYLRSSGRFMNHSANSRQRPSSSKRTSQQFS